MALLVATVCCIGCDLTSGATAHLPDHRETKVVVRLQTQRTGEGARFREALWRVRTANQTSTIVINTAVPIAACNFERCRWCLGRASVVAAISGSSGWGALNEIIRDAGYRPAILAANLFAERLVR